MGDQTMVGEAGSGGALVCLHGLGRAASDWDGVRSGLEAFGPVRCPRLPRAERDALLAAGAAAGDGAILVGHSMGALIALRLAADPRRRVRAVVLTGCFFPPARNGRSTIASVADYGAHRVAFARAAARARPGRGSRRGTAGALGSLIRLAVRPAAFDALTRAIVAPTIVLHARDDHHVPLNFALAAAARRPEWALHVFDSGGHHVHVDRPGEWLEPVTRWLRAGDYRDA